MSSYFEPDRGILFEPPALAIACIERGCRGLLLDDGVAPAEFFDLSTKVAGELLYQLGKYDIRLAVVVPDLTEHSQSLQALAAEARQGRSFRFVPTRAEAVEWLETGA